MQRHLFLAASLSAFTLLTAPAVYAQTSTPPNTEGTITQPPLQQAIEQKLIMASPAEQKALSAQPEGVQIDLRFKDVKNLPTDVSTSGVMIKGHTRYVEAQIDGETKRIGQLVLVGLAKDGKAVALDPNNFVSQFAIEDETKAELTSSDELEVNGNRSELIEALRKLNEQEPEIEEEEKEDEPQQQQESAQAPGNNASQNEQAANYSTPERLPAPEEPSEEFRTTTEGCGVRLDFNGEQAHQQSRVQHIVDGAIQDEGTCNDSGTSFPLKKNYQFCDARVDIESRTATALFEWFYTNDQAQYQKASECQEDPEKIYPITEKHGVCPIEINIAEETATPKSKLVYLGLNGIEEQVRDCSNSDEKPAVPLVQNTQSCSLRHDFGDGVSKEMATWTYELEGTIFQATPCVETGTEYSHNRIYKKDGNDVCTPIVNIGGSSVILQSRIEIVVDSLPQYITECTPDTGGALSIESTTETCEDPRAFDHDLAAGVSYGRKRFYYNNPNRVWVGECQIASDLIYSHEPVIDGWSNQDPLRAAYPLTTVTISPNGVPFEVAKSTVLPGATLIPYEFKETREDVVGNQYEGCDVIRLTAEVEVYQRPDQSEYLEQVGSGTPQDPVNACGTILQQPIWRLQSETAYIWLGSSSGSNPYYHNHSKSGIYLGDRTLQREDGAEITQTAKSTRSAICRTQTTGPNGAVPDYKYKANSGTITVGDYRWNKYGWTDALCPATYTGSDVYNWNQGEGW